MVGSRGMRALVGALLVMMLASIAGGFAPVSVAQTEGTNACGVDFAAMLSNAVNSVMYTLVELNISTDSAAWSLIAEANASVEAIAQAQAEGQCTTAMGLYLNATKKLSEAVAIAKREAAASADLMERQERLMVEIRTEIRAAVELMNRIREAFRVGKINESVMVQLEARVNASIQAMTQLEVRINASIRAGNLTEQAIQNFETQMAQIKAEIRAAAEALNEAIAESYRAQLREAVELRLQEALKEMERMQEKLRVEGVCNDLPEVCAVINQSMEQLRNLTRMLNQSINANMSAMAAMAVAAHAKIAAEGLMKAVMNVSAEVNASIKLHRALMNASAKLEQLKQAMQELKNEMASRHMPTQQIDMLIQQADQLKEGIRDVARKAHRHCCDNTFREEVSTFFAAARSLMMQLNQSMGMDNAMRERIRAVLMNLTEAGAAINATIEVVANVSAVFNGTCVGKAEALLEKSINVAKSVGRTLEALGLQELSSSVTQAVSNLEAALQAVRSGDNATAVQDIDAAISLLLNVKAQIGENSVISIYVSIYVRLSVSISLAESAAAQLQ